MKRAIRIGFIGGFCLLVAACGSTVPLASQQSISGTGQGLSDLNGGLTSTPGVEPSTPTSTDGTSGPATLGDRSSAPTPIDGGDTTPAVTPTPGVSESRATGIPATGPGWDKQNVYIGVTTEKDAADAFHVLGISFDPGDETAMFNAAIAYLNARGGLYGRKLVPLFHDNSTVSIESNPDAVAQTNCTYYSQDHRVTLVINELPAINLPPCLQKAKVPDFEASSVLFTRNTYSKYGPYLWTTLEPAADVMGSDYVSRSVAMGFFNGWNTTNGTAGKAPVKVGIFEPDTDEGRALTTTLTSGLKARGITVGASFAYDDAPQSYGGQMRAAVLKFKAAGVTHVMNIPPLAGAELFFLQAARSQHYQPRYALTTYSLPSQAGGDAPAGQLNGAMGIGWSPGVDVPTAQKPNAAAATCDATMHKYGVDTTTPFKAGNARATCDVVNLFVAAATAGGGLDAPSIARGMAIVGPSYRPGSTFSSALSETNHWLPGGARDLAYNETCKCFSYISPVNPITG